MGGLVAGYEEGRGGRIKRAEMAVGTGEAR